MILSASRQGIKMQSAGRKELERFVRGLVSASAQNGMEIVSCAEEIDLQPYGVKPGKCVDDAYIKQVFGMNVTHARDPSQRKACDGANQDCPAVRFRIAWQFVANRAGQQ